MGAAAGADWVDERPWQRTPDDPALRLVVDHDHEAGAQRTALRRARIAALEADGERWAAKLDAQDEGARPGSTVQARF